MIRTRTDIHGMQRQQFRPLSVLFLLLAFAAPAAAQGFGIGGRIASIRGNSQADTSAVRFLGGQVRMRSGKTGFELSLDRHREDNGDLTQRVVDYPLQATLMMY